MLCGRLAGQVRSGQGRIGGFFELGLKARGKKRTTLRVLLDEVSNVLGLWDSESSSVEMRTSFERWKTTTLVARTDASSEETIVYVRPAGFGRPLV